MREANNLIDQAIYDSTSSSIGQHDEAPTGTGREIVMVTNANVAQSSIALEDIGSSEGVTSDWCRH
jgi:hypothetical protein